MVKSIFVSVAALAACAGSALGQVNGFYKPAYGQPLALQGIGTGFGNSNAGSIQTANGSEINGGFAFEAGGNLNLLLTGNLESNFNKLVIFIDNGDAGGYNSLVGGVAGLPGNYNGMTLDQSGVSGATATFRASHWISVTCGGGPFGMYIDGGNLLTNTGGYLGGNDGQSGGALAGGTNVLNALVALDNSNVAGVDGAGGTAQGLNALTAFTGLEVQLPLASLGVSSWNGLKVMAFINGSSHDFLANQFLGSLPVGTNNLGNNGSGGLSNINLNDSVYGVGNQHFVLPTPGSIALLGLGGLLAARRRRA